MVDRASELLGPVFGIGDRGAYAVPRSSAPTDLRLDGNEGRAPELDLEAVLGEEAGELMNLYPSARELERELASRLGVAAEQVLVCAGADDATLRLCTALLGPGRGIVLPVPTFEMIERYAALRGCDIVPVPWPEGPYPREEVLAACGPGTALVTVVTPNNPTGAVATAEDLAALSAAVPQAVLMVDLAYAEFAAEDLTAAALELPNAVVLRTLSKAHGLAGLRVGYAAGPVRVVDWLRQAGNPFPVSGVSLALARAALDAPVEARMDFVAQVERERGAIRETVERLGGKALPSQANFVLCRFDDALWVRDALAGLGISVRAFPGREHLEDALRITCPGNSGALERLLHALETVLAPQALLFDMDGVLADVSGSYRTAILETARAFGVALDAGEVSAAKRAGDANDDWALTHGLIARHGVQATLSEVTERFEHLYQGTETEPGLRDRETLLMERPLLERLGARHSLAVVTGRPRSDAERFLAAMEVQGLFDGLVAREDAPLKPDPAPLTLALERLGVERAWYVGDTVDDVAAARAAGLLPLGVVAPGEEAETVRTALVAAGAARVMNGPQELEEILP